MGQRMEWLVKTLEESVQPNVCDVMEGIFEIHKDILELGDIAVSSPLRSRFRKLRVRSCLPVLEKVYWLDIRGETVLSTIATNLFVLDLALNYKTNLADWNREMEENGRLSTFEDLVPAEKVKFLVVEPEMEVFRIPMSQLVGNLKRLTDGTSKHFTAEEMGRIVDSLYDRTVLLGSLNLPEEDHDMPEYRLRQDHELFRTNYQFMAELRLYFDTLWKKVDDAQRFREKMQNDHPIPKVGVEELRTFIREKCRTFEREHFLKEFTEYVLNQKIMTPLLDKLYRQKFPDVSKPDARRIIKHFYGQEAVVDYSDFRHVGDLFEKKVDFSYEFATLFYLRMIHNMDPLTAGNSIGYLMPNPLDPTEHTYYDAQKEICRPFSPFMEALCFYLSECNFDVVTLYKTATELTVF